MLCPLSTRLFMSRASRCVFSILFVVHVLHECVLVELAQRARQNCNCNQGLQTVLQQAPSGLHSSIASTQPSDTVPTAALAPAGSFAAAALPLCRSGTCRLAQVEERLRASQVGRRGPPGEVLKLHINTPQEYGSSSSDGQGFCDGSAQAGLTLTGFPKGSALLIWNMLTDGSTPDASAAHLFCRGDTQVWGAGTRGLVLCLAAVMCSKGLLPSACVHTCCAAAAAGCCRHSAPGLPRLGCTTCRMAKTVPWHWHQSVRTQTRHAGEHALAVP